MSNRPADLQQCDAAARYANDGVEVTVALDAFHEGKRERWAQPWCGAAHEATSRFRMARALNAAFKASRNVEQIDETSAEDVGSSEEGGLSVGVIEAARFEAFQEAALIAEAPDRVGFEWVFNSLWDQVRLRTAADIRRAAHARRSR